MSDFHPEFRRDVSGVNIEAEVEQYFSEDERVAIEIGDFSAPADGDASENYQFICIVRGLNPQTQEPWTSDEISEFEELRGFDPRSIEGWFEDAEYLKSLYERYLHEKRRDEREQ